MKSVSVHTNVLIVFEVIYVLMEHLFLDVFLLLITSSQRYNFDLTLSSLQLSRNNATEFTEMA